MIITTPKGSRFDTDLPAKSSVLKVIDVKGRQVLDNLRLTGNYTPVKEFCETSYMIEVDSSYGITEVNEEFLWQ